MTDFFDAFEVGPVPAVTEDAAALDRLGLSGTKGGYMIKAGERTVIEGYTVVGSPKTFTAHYGEW